MTSSLWGRVFPVSPALFSPPTFSLTIGILTAAASAFGRVECFRAGSESPPAFPTGNADEFETCRGTLAEALGGFLSAPAALNKDPPVDEAATFCTEKTSGIRGKVFSPRRKPNPRTRASDTIAAKVRAARPCHAANRLPRLGSGIVRTVAGAVVVRATNGLDMVETSSGKR